MIKLENVSFKYDKEIFENVNLDIESKKATFVIGTNGSGKSTLANLISGLLFPNEGSIYLDELPLNKHTKTKEIRKKIGMVFQNPSNQILFPKVYDDIKFTLENIKIDNKDINSKIIDALSLVGMKEFMDANPYNLSGGEKQRIAIASQLSINPDYLIFDEATSMLDINGKREIYKLLNKLKRDIGIIFITNNMDELIYADDVIIIDNKKIYKYSINEIVKNNDILKEHNLDIPFIFKIATSLKIKDIKKISESKILERLDEI